MGSSVSAVLSAAKKELREHGIETCTLDAEVLLADLLGITRARLFADLDIPVGGGTVRSYNGYIAKRCAKMPVQYITGKCEFMSLPFRVDGRVLIPRPDTETLAEFSIELIKLSGYKTVLDIGTGSGCIAVSIAKYCGAEVTAVDISAGALSVCRKNAEINGVSDKITVIEGDLFDNVNGRAFDLIVSNPPYIKTDGIKDLDVNVRDYEPLAALDGGADGLGFYRKIIDGTDDYLNPNGTVIFETGFDQSGAVSALLRNKGYGNIGVIKDLAGFGRIVSGRKNNAG